MYSQGASKQMVDTRETYPSSEKEKALVSLSGRYEAALNEQEKLIADIQQRVNGIFNKKRSDQISEPMPPPAPVDDFLSEMSSKTDRLYSHNYILSRIANQLSEII